MKQALLYLRVSSKEQEAEGYSLDAQEKLGHEYARRKNFYVVKVWKVAESAWKHERKAFGQMVDFAARHREVEHLVFDSLDRMTRNDFDKLKIHRLIAKHGKTVHFSRSNRTMGRDTGPDEEFLFDIEVAVAKKLSNDISRKVSMAMLEKAEQGHFPTVAPVGYVNNPLTHRIEVDSERAPYVRKAFILAADGCSFGTISGIAEMFQEPFEAIQQTLELPKSLNQLYLAANYEQKAAILKLLASNYTLTDASIAPTYRKPSDMTVEGLHRT